MSIRTRAAAALLGAAGILAVLQAGEVHAQLGNRVYGSVTLNGAPAPIGTTIVALTGGNQVCATTTVTQLQANVSARTYPYVMDVPSGASAPECRPGAIITFTVGGVTAAQSFTIDDIGSFRLLDLTAPGTPNVPATTRAITLNAGCTDVTSTFPDNTPAATVAAAVTPSTALSAFWRFDAALNAFRGYGPASNVASDLTTVNRGDALRFCTGAAATLTLPA